MRWASEAPKRSELQAVKVGLPVSELHVFVVRNFAAEVVTRWAQAFLGVGGVAAEFAFSDYDDSLSSPVAEDADLLALMLDFRRYEALDGGLLDWIEGRVAAMRAMSDRPILVLGSDDVTRSRGEWNEALKGRLEDIPGVTVVDPGPSDEWDAQVAGAAQSPIYGKRAIEVARELGLRWIPGVLGRLVRLLIVDLDNTLYSGALGEDGIDGIVVSAKHRDIHTSLARLHDHGVLLAVSSRNDVVDVEALLASGRLGPLTREHFFAVEADWGSKSDHVGRILNAANFDQEFAVFVDDNPGEILQVSGVFPELPVIFAENAEATRVALEWFPGLWRPSVSSADALRTRDLVANRTRQSLTASDPATVLAQLQVTILVDDRPRASVERLAELSGKTNQFNTNLARLPESVLAGRCASDEAVLVGFSLADRFADSGIVGSLSGLVQGDALVLDDVAISCRALGRGVEDLVLDEILGGLAARHGVARVEVLATEGPRNGPALAWLQRAAERVDDDRWRWVRRDSLSSLASLVNIVWTNGDGSGGPKLGGSDV